MSPTYRSPVQRAPRCVFAIVALLFVVTPSVWSWNVHSMLTRAALSGEQGMEARIAAEELEDFLKAEADALVKVLAEIEARAAKELPAYAELPPALVFNAQGQSLRDSFLRALRVNPRVPLGLYRQPAAGESASGRPTLTEDQYAIVGVDLAGGPIEALLPGELVTILDVVATGSDEPDFGLDVGLYIDNQGPLGRDYGFGEQPYGNPALSYGSQAPFHMAFPREDPIIALAASFSTKSQAAYREMQFSTLARFAFKSGHPFWGWRFAGWALHYSQDLGQPYHAKMIPGQNTLEMLVLNTLGSTEEKDGVLILLSNRHLVIESYAYEALKDPSNRSRQSFEAALAGTGPGETRTPAYRRSWLYDVVAEGSYRTGKKLDSLIVASFPAHYVNDPSFDYGLADESGAETWKPYGGTTGDAASARLDAALSERYRAIGAETRAFIAYMRNPDIEPGARHAPFDPRGALYVVALILIVAGLARLVYVAVRAGRRRRRQY